MGKFAGLLVIICALGLASACSSTREAPEARGERVVHVAAVTARPPATPSPAPVHRSTPSVPPKASTVLRGYPAFAATVTSPSIVVHASPDEASPTVARLDSRNAYGAPSTFLVQERSGDWYRVSLPTPPNGSRGWVRASDVRVSGLSYAVVVHLGAMRLDLLKNGHVVRTFPVGIGRPQTPTPPGSYYVTELIRPATPNTPYGADVLGLSGRSLVSGVQLALHGTNDPSTIGRAASNGCVHLRDLDIEAISRLLPLGTPVTIGR